MTIREELLVPLRRDGWAAVCADLAELAEHQHPKSLLAAGLRMAAIAARKRARKQHGRPHTASGQGPTGATTAAPAVAREARPAAPLAARLLRGSSPAVAGSE